MENPWIPDYIKAGLTVKQAEFLVYEGREALFGGAAGPGKSVALLIAALQYIDEPNYSALILRRTYKQLAKSDSILNKSKEWLWGRTDERGKAVKWNGDDHKWTFPNGNTLEFGHMADDNAIWDYQGGSWPFVGVDECTQFKETMLSYPRTRQRRPTGSKIPIRWRGASNPGGIGHEYVKRRYVKGSDGKSPATPNRQFFPAKLEDNPNIDQEDYVKQLKESGVDPITLSQILGGDWDAYAGGRFLRAWFKRWEHTHVKTEFRLLPNVADASVKFIPQNGWKMVFQTMDSASSEKTTADWTVIGTFALTHENELVWLDCERFQKQIPDIPPMALLAYKKWNPSFMAIEGVAGNTAVFQHCNRLPMIVKLVSPMGKDKLVRATSAMVFANEGRLYLPLNAPWLDDVESELLRFTGNEDEDAHDDVVDVLSYAAAVLQGRMPTVQKPQQAGKSAPLVHAR